jgi:uncharacterized protein
MNLEITAFYAAILGVLLVYLSVTVSLNRGKAGVMVGDGGNQNLLVHIRRHANFAEGVPMALILMMAVEAGGQEGWIIHTLGLALVAARCIHLMGLTPAHPGGNLRVVGAVGTLSVTLAAAALIFWQYLM